MCGSMVDIQSAATEIRRGIKKMIEEEDRKKPQGKNIMSASATQGGHKYALKWRYWENIYTVVSKNVPLLDSYNFETWERILIFFGRNVTDKVSNQRRITMPPQITCASAVPGKMEKHENRIFTQMLYHCISLIQPAVWFLHLFDSRLTLTMLYNFLNHIINSFSYKDCWRHGSGKRK